MGGEMKRCPFCGAKPRADLGKKSNCQLHGEPAQPVIVYCYNAECKARPSVAAGDVFNGGEAAARDAAIAAWNRRSPDPELVEALEFYAEHGAGCRKLSAAGDPSRHALDADGGKRARALLSRIREGGEG